MLNPGQGRRGLSKAASLLPETTRWEHPPPNPSFPSGNHSHPRAGASPRKVRPNLQTTKRCCASRPARAGLRTVDAPTGPYVDLCVNHSPLRPNADARGAADLKSPF